MVTVRRAGSGGLSEDQEALEWLEKMAAKGEITDEEAAELLEEMGSDEALDARESWEVIRERYKREKAQQNFESGAGGFRRSK